MNSAFVEFISNLADREPETTVADVLDRIMLERQCIEVDGQDAFSLDELAEIERKWRILIRSFEWSPDVLLSDALGERRDPTPWWRAAE